MYIQVYFKEIKQTKKKADKGRLLNYKGQGHDVDGIGWGGCLENKQS